MSKAKTRSHSKDNPKDSYHIKHFSQKWWAIPLVALVIAISLISINQLLSNVELPILNKSKAVAQGCANKSPITFNCYKVELTNTVKNHGSKKAFDQLKEQYPKVEFVKSQCHQLVHVVGRASYAKYGNLAETFANGDRFCWSGYYHGVMEQIAIENGNDYIVQNANTICEPIARKERYSFYHYNCVHGLGHGVMHALDGNLFTSLTACDNIVDSWERTSCYGGTFMQNIMNQQSPDETAPRPSAYLRSNEPMYPCTAVETKYKNECYLMQTSHALQLFNYDFNRVFEACAAVEEAFRLTCYISIGRDSSGQSVSDVIQTRDKCLLGPTHEARKYCIHGAAVDFVSYFNDTKEADKLCNSLPGELQDDCRSSVKRQADAL